MPQSIRHVGSRTPHSDLLPEDDTEEQLKPKPLDPAKVAAGILLSRAFAMAGTTAEAAGRDGTLCVVAVAAASWVAPVRDEWRARVRGGEHHRNGNCGEVYDYDGTWIAWLPEEQPSAHDARRAADSLAKCVANGRHCIGISPSPDWLPADLLAAADYRLELPPISGADVAAVAVELCGGFPDAGLTDGEAARLTPRLLRLARRMDQTPDGYVRKLAELLEREAAPAGTAAAAKGGSPRDEPTLDRMHGMDEAVAWGIALAADLDGYRTGKIPWSAVDGGCLLSGPPGCGKTLFARALASTCGIPLVRGSYGQWHGSGAGHQGDFLKAMQKSFADARRSVPSILFIDEADSFPNRGTLSHSHADYMVQVVNAVLAEIDGAQGRDGVVILAACNHPHLLDPALVRAGRLDRHIRIALPDAAALARIFREHLGGDIEGADLTHVALSALGSTGADCEQLVREARRRARAESRPMRLGDLAGEVSGEGAGTEHDRWTAAVHESGHAVAACLLRPGSLEGVSLRGGSDRGGHAVLGSLGPYPSADDMHARMVVTLSGRAAEEILMGRPSAGSGGGPGSDLALATMMATSAVTAFGFDADVGLTWFGQPNPAGLAGLLADPLVSAAVGAALDRAHAAALGLVGDHGEAVQAVAEALLHRLALDGNEVAAIVNRASRGSDTSEAGTGWKRVVPRLP